MSYTYVARSSLTSSLQVFKETITNKWREEIQTSNQDISSPMLEYIISELRDKAEFCKQTGGTVVVYEFGIIKSDFAVPEATRLALMDAVHVLEETTPVDYHPGSDNRVVDLIHPSMFPLVYGRSRILRDQFIGLEDCLKVHPSEGEIIPVPPEEEAKLPPPNPKVVNYSQLKAIQNPYSLKFQWLPCDVQMEWPSGCKVTSYINNLHPTKDAKLYPIIEEIIACAIPLWNYTLGPLDGQNCRHNDVTRSLSPTWPPNRITYSNVRYRGETPANGRRFTAAEVVQPEPREYTPWEPPYIDLRLDYWGSLQVIVKLANIELTPEKPVYEGGSWHVEGQLVRLNHQTPFRYNILNPTRTNTSAPQLYTTTLAQT